MSYITFLCLKFLLMSSYAFGAESSESEEIFVEDLKDLLCDEKNAEDSKIIVGCFDEMSLSEYSFIAIKCYAGLNEEINGQVMREWYCSHTKEEMINADKCSDEMVIAEKGEEFLNKAFDLFGECVESKFPSDKRRK